MSHIYIIRDSDKVLGYYSNQEFATHCLGLVTQYNKLELVQVTLDSNSHTVVLQKLSTNQQTNNLSMTLNKIDITEPSDDEESLQESIDEDDDLDEDEDEDDLDEDDEDDEEEDDLDEIEYGLTDDEDDDDLDVKEQVIEPLLAKVETYVSDHLKKGYKRLEHRYSSFTNNKSAYDSMISDNVISINSTENVPEMMQDKKILFDHITEYNIPIEDQFDYFDENYIPKPVFALQTQELCSLFPQLQSNILSNDTDDESDVSDNSTVGSSDDS